MNVKIQDLPPPPSGRSGWPWTDASPQLPQKRPDGSEWPRITIVTPSYNQGEYIEETIRSILLQGYPNLEYFVMDGGSTDGAVDVIRKYARWIDYWESVPDQGQAHAINKGLKRATGDWFHNVNSDDFLSYAALGSIFQTLKEGDVIAFPVRVFDEKSEWVAENKNITLKNFILARPEDFSWHQPGLILRTEGIQLIGGYYEKYYLFDMFLYGLYLERYSNIVYYKDTFVNFRFHQGSQTFSARLHSDGHYVDVRRRWSKHLSSKDLRALARTEEIRCRIEQLLLSEERRHKASLHLSLYACAVAMQSRGTLTDRVMLAGLKRTLLRLLDKIP